MYALDLAAEGGQNVEWTGRDGVLINLLTPNSKTK